MDHRGSPLIRVTPNKTVLGITAAPMTPNHLLSKGPKKNPYRRSGRFAIYHPLISGVLRDDAGGTITAC